jgi:hypothetical protein
VWAQQPEPAPAACDAPEGVLGALVDLTDRVEERRIQREAGERGCRAVAPKIFAIVFATRFR